MAAAAPPPPNIARIIAPTRALAHPGHGRVERELGVLAPISRDQQQLRITGSATAKGHLYYRVLLPQRPNGAAGWVSADKVIGVHTAYRITVNRAARSLVVWRGRQIVRRSPVVVGKTVSPTPAGQFAISEFLRQSSPFRFVGTWVLPLTAFSGTYKQFDGGPGRVALHGRAGASLLDPLGTARSHGCVRMPNGMVSWIASHLQPGVEVTIL